MWGEVNKKDPTHSQEVKLCAVMPPIKKMDSAQLSMLKSCEKLSLSTNSIERIAPLKLKKLKILSLGRNKITKIDNLQSVSSTLEQLWISYNFITSLEGVLCCTKLHTLYCSNNKITKWSEIAKLKDLKELRDVVFYGNDIQRELDEHSYRIAVLSAIPQVKKIDGKLVTPIEREEASNA